MSEHFRKYNSIVRMGHRDSHGVLKEGDYIVVWEKLDGSNASFKLVDGEILAFSRNLPLTEENNLNGFYQWTQTLPKNELDEGATYYGEWLVPHKVDYGENARQFYLFDVWQEVFGDMMAITMAGGDTDSLPYDYAQAWEVAADAARIGINMAPILYSGTYRGYEHLQSLVGRSALAVDPLKGEGIVVKNYDYRSKHGTRVWLKMVSDSFAEVKKVKKPRDPALESAAQRLARETITQARVDKAVDKLIEMRVIKPEDLEIENMGNLIKLVGTVVYEDIVAEEAPQDADEAYYKDLKKPVGKIVPKLLRQRLEQEAII